MKVYKIATGIVINWSISPFIKLVSSYNNTGWKLKGTKFQLQSKVFTYDWHSVAQGH